MPINNITQTISTIPPAGARGVDVQTVFVNKQEDFQDHLQGVTVTELNTLKDQLNSRIGEINSTTTTMNGYATSASSSATSASSSASTATTKAGEASASATAALNSKNQASTFATNSSNSATKSSQWADNNYNVAVEAGKYSAKHWATEAQNVVLATVKLTENQTIAGIKTFTSSPIVPAPTTNTQAANKQYVDDNNKINTLTNKTTPVNADELVIADSASSFSLKKLSFTNLKATLLTYFDTLYSRTSSIFGIGQTWQNVTASRSLGVTYTNNTGKPIQVIVTTIAVGGSDFWVNNYIICSSSGANTNSGIYNSAIVPNEQTYKVTGNSAIAEWVELR